MRNKKRIILVVTLVALVAVLAVAAFVLPDLYHRSVTDYEGVYVGMPYQELRKAVPDGNQDYFYYFYENKWGNPVVVLLASDGENRYVSQVRCFSSLWISRTPRAFRRIQYGMSVFDVVQTVGLPLEEGGTSGLWASRFEDIWGETYGIFWQEYDRENTSLGAYAYAMGCDGEGVLFDKKSAE